MDKSIDITKYPEGFMEVIKSLDFLPDDENIRIDFINAMLATIIMA